MAVQHSTTARPYARAVFAEASSQNLLHEWRQVLAALSLVGQDPQALRLLGNPNVSDEQRIQLFIDVATSACGSSVEKIKTGLQNFITTLCVNRRLGLLPGIALLFKELLAERESVMSVEVTSANPLDTQQREKLQKELEGRFESKLSVEYKQDESLLEGVVVRSGNWVMDDSARGRLRRLQEVLTR